MIKLYGSPASRALRNMWALEELGLPYEIVRIIPKNGDNKTPAYLALNPAGKIPTLVDGDVTMSESLAINLYIGETYGQGKLWPPGDDAHAKIIQWTVWAGNELEPITYGMLFDQLFVPAESRKPETMLALGERLAPRMDLLTKYLDRHKHLISAAFTLADLQVACVLDYAGRANFSLAPWPKVNAWHAACQARPAYKKIMDLRAAFVQANP